MALTSAEILSIPTNSIVDSEISAAAAISSSKLQFVQGGVGAVPWSVQDRLRVAVNVKDFGATGDGVTDDSPAFQQAFDQLQASGGCLYIPAGEYLFNSVATFANQNISIIGEGAEVVQLIGNNSTGIFLLDLTGYAAPPPNIMEWRCYLSNFTCWPNVTRTTTWGGSGTAIRVNRSPRPLSHQTQNQTFENIVIRLSDRTPWQTSGTSPQFDNAIYLTNASQTIIHNCFIDGPGCHESTAVYVENSTAIGSGADGYYAFRMTNTDIAGWQRGVYITGWIESIYIDNCSATSCLWNCILVDSTGTTLGGTPGCYSADFHIVSCHFNGQANCLGFINCKDIQVMNNNMYLQWNNTPGAFTGDLSFISVNPATAGQGEVYMFEHNFFNSAWTADTSSKNRLAYIDFPNGGATAAGIVISNNIFKAPAIGGGQLPANNYGFYLVGNLTDIQISGNNLSGTTTVNMTGVFCQSVTLNVSSLVLSNNIYRDFYNTLWFVDTAFAQVNQGTIASVKSGGSKIINGGSSPGVLDVNNLYNYP